MRHVKFPNGAYVLSCKVPPYCLQLLSGREPTRNCPSFHMGVANSNFKEMVKTKIKMYINYIMSCAYLTHQSHIYKTRTCGASSAAINEYNVSPTTGLLQRAPNAVG